jgi:hypothetical protein
MDHETRLRLIDMYTNMLNYTYMNYIQTNTTIQQIEVGLRELIRHNGYDTNVPNYTNTRQYEDRSYTPVWSSRPNLYNPVSSRIFGTRADAETGAEAGAGAGTNPRANPRANPRSNGSDNRVNRTVRTRQNSYRSSRRDMYTPIFTTMFNLDNLTPVVVRPTDSQIENATERIPFDQTMVNTSCPITQSPFQTNDRIIRIRHCGHCFIEEGLIDWFRQSVRCPVCRYDIRNNSRTQTIDASANMHTNNNTASANATTNLNTTRNINQNSNDISSNFITTHANSQSIDNLLSLFTNQISDTFRQYLASSDVSYNSMNNGIIDVEYIIHSPTTLYTTPASSSRLFGEVTSNHIPTNNNNDNTETYYNDNSHSDSDTDHDN